MKIIVDRALCDGNSVCALEAPDILAMNENDELVVLIDEFGPELEQQALAAIRVCPKRALQLER